MTNQSQKKVEELEDVTIRFAGDSGDGMQLTGSQFTFTSAAFGNDISTLPDYPAEIRAPAGSLAGVSSFQLNFSSKPIMTPGDTPSVLVAMNPAALAVFKNDLKKGGMVIVNKDAFTERNYERAGLTSDPLTDGSLSDYRVVEIPISSLNLAALDEIDLPSKAKDRCKNLFALGVLYWMYHRPLDHTLSWIEKKFAKNPKIVEANQKVLKAGYYFGETTELIPASFTVAPAEVKKGTYRNIAGNEATALGFAAAGSLADSPIVYCTYPITPASDVLHELAKLKNLGIKTIQCEDEIAGIGAAIGASFGGHIGVTGTSGPGLALKGEALGLAVMTELPLVLLNVQRAGPSTGLPTKVEQADLYQAMYGRNGESPCVVIAAQSPADCFNTAIEACRIAIKYMTPVVMLTDGYVANSSEPWLLPDMDKLEKIDLKHPTEAPQGQFFPYLRDEKTLARPWAVPGTPGYEHRLGGLEKSDLTGDVSYDGPNHEHMVKMRAEKVKRVADMIAPMEVQGEAKGEILVIGWGGTYGAISTACDRLRKDGYSVSNTHLRHINPLPKDLAGIIKNYEKVIIPEINSGQLKTILRAEYLVDAQGINKVQGKPFKVEELYDGIAKYSSQKRQVANG